MSDATQIASLKLQVSDIRKQRTKAGKDARARRVAELLAQINALETQS